MEIMMQVHDSYVARGRENYVAHDRAGDTCSVAVRPSSSLDIVLARLREAASILARRNNTLQEIGDRAFGCQPGGKTTCKADAGAYPSMMENINAALDELGVELDRTADHASRLEMLV